MAAVVYTLRRTIVTPLGSQQEYAEITRLVSSLNYWRAVVPSPVDWDEFSPWSKQDDAGMNLVCLPFRLLYCAMYLIGFVCTPIISLFMLLFYPCFALSQAVTCGSGDFKEGVQCLYELHLSAIAAYPMHPSCIQDDIVYQWLAAHGVSHDHLLVLDGPPPTESCCVTVPMSRITVENMRAYQAEGGQGDASSSAMPAPLLASSSSSRV